MQTIVTHSAEETFAFAEQLGRTLKPGAFVLLHGDLGAGQDGVRPRAGRGPGR